MKLQIPLKLWNRPRWELRGRADKVKFFSFLAAAFPAATLFVEGTSIAPAVQEFLASAAEAGAYLPARNTIWPRPKQFRIRADDSTLAQFSQLAAKHSEPELADHLFVYSGDEPVLEWPDAFDPSSPMLISRDADEQRIKQVAQELGLDLRKMDGS